IASRDTLAVFRHLELRHAVLGLGKDRERDGMARIDERAQPPAGFLARRLQVLPAQDPELWNAKLLERRHRVVAEGRVPAISLALLADRLLAHAQDEVRVVAVHVLEPGLLA